MLRSVTKQFFRALKHHFLAILFTCKWLSFCWMKRIKSLKGFSKEAFERIMSSLLCYLCIFQIAFFLKHLHKPNLSNNSPRKWITFNAIKQNISGYFKSSDSNCILHSCIAFILCYFNAQCLMNAFSVPREQSVQKKSLIQSWPKLLGILSFTSFYFKSLHTLPNAIKA